MALTFSQHGDFDLAIEGNILIAHLYGSWNIEAAKSFEEHFMDIAAPLIGHSWGHIVYFDDWDLGVPEITPVIERLVGWCIENNLKRAAQVYSASVAKKHYIDIMIIEAFGDFQRQVFIEENLAIEWLNNEGFSL